MSSLDINRTKELLQDLEAGIFVSFSHLFTEEFERNMSILEKRISDHDVPGIRFLAHKMKSSAGNIGAVGLQNDIDFFDQLSDTQDFSEPRHRWESLHDQFNHVKKDLEIFIDTECGSKQ